MLVRASFNERAGELHLKIQDVSEAAREVRATLPVQQVHRLHTPPSSTVFTPLLRPRPPWAFAGAQLQGAPSNA